MLKKSSARFWIVAFCAAEGALHAWAHRFALNPDGVAYLDISDAFLKGDWKNTVTGHWSPLYPALIALTRLGLNASARWDFPIVHLTNFIIYLGALASFTFLLREIRRSSGFLREMEWTWMGYILFLSCSLYGISLGLLTPDMLVACLVFLAAGLLLRIRNGDSSWRTRIFFGSALGLGFLAKAPMFPMACLFLPLAYAASYHHPQSLRKALGSAAVFILISAPFILAVSKMKGRLTFGDSAKLNYMIFVNHSIDEVNWHPVGTQASNALHPLRLIFENPRIYEFTTPISGTYPPWDDPTYWTDGLKPTFNFSDQWRAFKQSLRTLFSIVAEQTSSLILGFIFLGFAGYFKRRAFMKQWVLWIPAVGAVAMFSLVILASRYIAAYLLLLWLTLACSFCFPENKTMDRWRRVILFLMLASPLANLTNGTFHRLRIIFHQDLYHQEYTDLYAWRIAALLKQSGLREGETIAVGGMDGYSALGWARLSRTRIVAQVNPEEDDFFYDLSVRPGILPALASSGAAVVIAQRSKIQPPAGWQPLGGTGLWEYRVPPAKSPPDRTIR